MHIAGATTPGADCQFTCYMRLGSGCEGSSFLMPYANPFDILALANFFQNAIEGISNDAVDALHTSGD
jgi:hypothetical protein